MSGCNLNGFSEGRGAYPCERCGTGPCHIWRNAHPIEPIEVDKRGDAADASPIPTEPHPDPAYAAALSEQAILVEARAKAFELAMKLAAQSDRAAEVQFPELISISNRVLAYLLEGK